MSSLLLNLLKYPPDVEQRRKLAALLSLKLSDVTLFKRPREFVMSEISRNAQTRELTPEILDSILNEE